MVSPRQVAASSARLRRAKESEKLAFAEATAIQAADYADIADMAAFRSDSSAYRSPSRLRETMDIALELRQNLPGEIAR